MENETNSKRISVGEIGELQVHIPAGENLREIASLLSSRDNTQVMTSKKKGTDLGINGEALDPEESSLPSDDSEEHESDSKREGKQVYLSNKFLAMNWMSILEVENNLQKNNKNLKCLSELFSKED